jgi:phosphatidylglycerophosphatase A
VKRFAIKFFASGLGTGYSPIVPGTTGTVPAWLLVWFVFAGNQTVLVLATVVMLFLSVWLAGAAEKLYGHDSKKIVTDEWAGMFIAVLFVPYTLTNYVIAFVAFRLFDVIKLPPAAQAERLERGWGVTMDDVVAGVQANIVTQVAVWLLASFHAG